MSQTAACQLFPISPLAFFPGKPKGSEKAEGQESKPGRVRHANQQELNARGAKLGQYVAEVGIHQGAFP